MFRAALYSFGVFGYVTATLATFFIGSDAESDEAGIANARSIEALRKDIEALRDEILKQLTTENTENKN